jgi:hypothetical protein
MTPGKGLGPLRLKGSRQQGTRRARPRPGLFSRAVGKISLIIDDEREDKLRKMAIGKFGLKRGYLTKALEEAIMLWMKENKDYLKPEKE